MTEAQVGIVGGGVMGVSLLFHLTELGVRNVVLFEKNDLTHGSTWHAAGLCTHFAHNATIQALRAHSVKLYRDALPQRTGQSCGFHRSGAMRVTRSADRMDEFRHVAGLSTFTGYPLHILNADAISHHFPLAQTDGLLGGIYEPDDGHVDPTLATQAMAQLAVAAGATILRRCAVVDITKKNGHWQVTTTNGNYKVQQLVNAAGTWGYEVGQMMGVNVPSVPVLHQYLVTGPIASIVQRNQQQLPELPIIRDPEESWYVRQEREGLIVGPYEKDAQVWSPDKVPPQFGAELLPPDLDRVEPILEAAMQRIPDLADAGIKTVVNGPITFTPDANPLIGPAAERDDAWLLTGSSMGVMEGGGAGWFLAHWMLNGAPPMDAQSVDPRRFGEWVDRDYRIKKAVECFGLQFGVHYPYEERPAARDRRHSPLHQKMIDHGAVMGAANGWERPLYFTRAESQPDLTFARPGWFPDVAAEVAALSANASVADLSALSKFTITGPDTLACLESLGANKAPAPGRVTLTHVLSDNGGVVSEFTVAVVHKSHAYLTSAALSERIDYAALQKHAGAFNVKITNVTQTMACIALSGPRSIDIVQNMADTDVLGGMSWFNVKTCRLNGIECIALRLSYTGECGWEFHVNHADAVALYEHIVSASIDQPIGHHGAYALNSMRLEKGYAAWGSELTIENTPPESAAGRFVRAGYAPLRNKSKTRLVEINNADAFAFYAHPVFFDNTVVGVVTSAAYGFRTKKVLAFVLLNAAQHESTFEVEVLGVRYPATVLKEVPYDPLNSLQKG